MGVTLKQLWSGGTLDVGSLPMTSTSLADRFASGAPDLLVAAPDAGGGASGASRKTSVLDRFLAIPRDVSRTITGSITEAQAGGYRAPSPAPTPAATAAVDSLPAPVQGPAGALLDTIVQRPVLSAGVAGGLAWLGLKWLRG
jgi:hypothetical protein